MSVTVSKLVWAYGPKVRGPRMLLLAIAEYANDDGVAWPGLERLAADILQDKRTVQRISERLARDGWMEVLPRTAPVRMSNGQYENRGTSYRINLAKLRGELPTRQGERSAAGAGDRWLGAVETARRDDKTLDPRRQNEQSETTKSVSRDDKIGAPLMNYQEPSRNHQGNTTIPLPLPPGEERAKTGNGKSANQEQERKANATARVIPFRRRHDVDPREGLGAEELVLFEITMNVLGECGIAAKNATRRQRLAVSEALMDEAKRSEEPLPLVASRAITRWDEYLEAHAAGLLFRVVGVRQFFGEGYWLENAGHPWDWDKAAIAERQRRSNAGVGMR